MKNQIEAPLVGEFIKELRKSKHLTQSELAKMLGFKDRSSIARIEQNTASLTLDTIVKLRDIFGVTLNEILGYNDEVTTKKIPVVGRVAAGIPITAVEEIIDWEEVPLSMIENERYFGLKIKGDSMSPMIENGDTVLVREQSDADNGDIVVVLVDGDEGTCKKLRKTDEGLMLISLNNEYEPMYFTKRDIKSLPIRIVGKVMEIRRKI